ncbi:Rieske (2Fe-2S) protein [bacterium]|nr:Rieske (2Fe-2S) protein [bacterium]
MASPTRPTYRWTDYLLGILILIATGTVIYPVTRYLQPRHTPPVFSGTLLPVAHIGEIPDNQALLIEYAGKPWVLLRTEHGITALSGICTYRGSQLGWDTERSLLVCSGHGCTFDQYGNVLWGLATAPLETLQVRMVEERIYVARRAP